MRYFEDFEVGVWQENGTYEVTEAEIIEVAERWDPQPFHVDPVAAAESPFGGLVACSGVITGPQRRGWCRVRARPVIASTASSSTKRMRCSAGWICRSSAGSVPGLP